MSFLTAFLIAAMFVIPSVFVLLAGIYFVKLLVSASSWKVVLGGLGLLVLVIFLFALIIFSAYRG